MNTKAIKIKIDTHEIFKEYGRFFNDNGYLNSRYFEGCYSNWIFKDKQYNELESIINNKAKALLSLNHKMDILTCVAKNIIFNNCKFSIEEVKDV